MCSLCYLWILGLMYLAIKIGGEKKSGKQSEHSRECWFNICGGNQRDYWSGEAVPITSNSLLSGVFPTSSLLFFPSSCSTLLFLDGNNGCNKASLFNYPHGHVRWLMPNTLYTSKRQLFFSVPHDDPCYAFEALRPRNKWKRLSLVFRWWPVQIINKNIRTSWYWTHVHLLPLKSLNFAL